MIIYALLLDTQAYNVGYVVVIDSSTGNSGLTYKITAPEGEAYTFLFGFQVVLDINNNYVAYVLTQSGNTPSYL